MRNSADRRREWEQEIRDAQGGLEQYGNFRRGWRQGYLFYRKWAGRPLIRDGKHGLRFLAGIVIACCGLPVAASLIAQASIREVAEIAVLITGLALAWSAFDFS